MPKVRVVCSICGRRRPQRDYDDANARPGAISHQNHYSCQKRLYPDVYEGVDLPEDEPDEEETAE